MSASKEKQAFDRFCALRQIDVVDVEDRSPPEPDIVATINEARIAFELTEAVEPHYARKLSDMYKTPEIVRDGFDAAPEDLKTHVTENHNGKMIDPCFKDGISLRARQDSLAAVFEYIAGVPAEFGSAGLERIENPIDELDHIAMSQVGWDGINWQPGAPAGWIDPESALVERLIDKMTNKTYQTEHPIDLIVYLDKEVGPPPDMGWVEALSATASERLADSPFRNVWLMDLWSDSVYELANEGSN